MNHAGVVKETANFAILCVSDITYAIIVHAYFLIKKTKDKKYFISVVNVREIYD